MTHQIWWSSSLESGRWEMPNFCKKALWDRINELLFINVYL